MTPKSVFDSLLRDIEPSPTTTGQAAKAHRAVRDFLREDPRFREVHVETFLSGSYVRDTAIRPRVVEGVLQRPDVDIIVVTNYTQADDPVEVVNFLVRRLRHGFNEVVNDELEPEEKPVRRQQRSSRVITPLAVMDV